MWDGAFSDNETVNAFSHIETYKLMHGKHVHVHYIANIEEAQKMSNTTYIGELMASLKNWGSGL